MTQHPLDQLEPPGKPPATARAIEKWIQQAEHEVGSSLSLNESVETLNRWIEEIDGISLDRDGP